MSLCAETKSLADTLEGLAKIVESGLNEYPAGSLERMQASEKVFGPSKLVDRLRTLEGCVHVSLTLNSLWKTLIYRYRDHTASST